MSNTCVPPPPLDPQQARALVDLLTVLKRAILEVETSGAVLRRHAEGVTDAWRGGRRIEFDRAFASLEAARRRAIDDLRSLLQVATTKSGGLR